MLDDRMRTMLEEANTLTGEDLEFLRSDGLVVSGAPAEQGRKAPPRFRAKAEVAGLPAKDAEAPTLPEPPGRTRKRGHAAKPVATVAPSASPIPAPAAPTGMSSCRGDYERKRTRESKVSTACLGTEREKHEWWPLGTELVGKLHGEQFTATVIENANVKSGRSLVITSWPANGTVCLTPTRAAIEATEVYRNAKNLGRGGGVTNGWTFWQPRGGS
jgi:hypothetical protein